jgi:hypothetical protein
MRNGCTSERRFPISGPWIQLARKPRSLADRGSDFPVLRRPGGYSGEPKPDPIPNSAVKFSCANGTKSRRLGRVGRCQACQGQEKKRSEIDLISSSRFRFSIRNDRRGSREVSCARRQCLRDRPSGRSTSRHARGKEASSSQWLGSLLHRPRGSSSRNVVAAIERIDAGWSSPVARQAHNLKVVGSNPTPATKRSP